LPMDKFLNKKNISKAAKPANMLILYFFLLAN